jgi:hypothetical protein
MLVFQCGKALCHFAFFSYLHMILFVFLHDDYTFLTGGRTPFLICHRHMPPYGM